MSTTFPTTIDTFVNPNAGNLLSDAAVLHSTQHTNLNDAVAAIQADVGVTGSAVVGTVKNRLGAVESGKQATLVSATNIKTVNGASLLGAGDLPVASTRTFRGVVASQAAMLALATVNVGDWVERSDLSNQIFELTTAGQATLANWTAYPSGGASTLAALTDIASYNIPANNTPTANAIALKANAASPVFTGPVTSSGSFVQTPYTIASSQINVAGGEGVVSIAVDTTFTFIGSPAAGEYFAATITNTDTVSHLISFPACTDMITGLTVSAGASRLGAGGIHKYIWQYNGTVYQLYSNTSAAGPQVNSQSVNYTTVMADANNIVEHPATDVTARTFTLDANVSVPYPVGTKIIMPNGLGAGVLSVTVAGTDTSNLAGSATTGIRTVAPGGCAICLKVSQTGWQIGGPGVA